VRKVESREHIRWGAYWSIPADAEKPKDERIRTGKYIKNKED